MPPTVPTPIPALTPAEEPDECCPEEGDVLGESVVIMVLTTVLIIVIIVWRVEVVVEEDPVVEALELVDDTGLPVLVLVIVTVIKPDESVLVKVNTSGVVLAAAGFASDRK